ncbi:MAG: glycosyltransferase [Moraxellaceae bacterium]|nr:glycosyltransferase [Moraxellaceae bacterium]
MVKSNTPLVTVAIPSYNHAAYVAEAIDSVIKQTYQNIELIIIDDGSGDDSKDVIESLREKVSKRFVRYELRSRANVGLCRTLNEALSWSQGEYFCALASDDVMYPDRVAIQVSTLVRHIEVVGAFGRMSAIDEGSNLIREGKKRRLRRESFESIFLRKASLPAPTAMLRKGALVAAGGYNETNPIEDFDLWLRLTSNGDFLLNSGDVLTAYRSHGDNTSKQQNKLYVGARQSIECFSSHPLYRKAVCKTLVIAAEDVMRFDRSQARKFLLEAFTFRWLVVFNVRYLKGWLRLI